MSDSSSQRAKLSQRAEPSHKSRLAGKGLYIAVAAWFALVLVGGLCTWYGWMAPSEVDATPTPDARPVEDPTEPARPEENDDEDPVADPSPLPGIDPADTPEPTPVEEGEFGYGIALNAVGGGDPAYWLGQVESLGMGWVKQQIKWRDWEGTPGEMDWSGFDAFVDEAVRRDLRIMFSVVDAPEWSRSRIYPEMEGGPPDNLGVMADFLERLIDRYEGRIHAIEVWNEQNLDREWDTAEGVDAGRYVELLRLSYGAIKSRDPDIMVISGALSPTGGRGIDPDDPDRVIWLDDFEYFDQMIELGALNYADCVGAHHNGINLPPDVEWDEGYDDPTAEFRGPFDNPHHSWSFKSTLWGYHERIQAAGYDLPLCVTEFGWASAEGFDGYPQGFEFALDNTLEQQAEWNVRAFQLMREWGFVRLAFLWNLNYSQLGFGPEDPNAPYGIIDMEGAPRPAFEAIREMERP